MGRAARWGFGLKAEAWAASLCAAVPLGLLLRMVFASQTVAQFSLKVHAIYDTRVGSINIPGSQVVGFSCVETGRGSTSRPR